VRQFNAKRTIVFVNHVDRIAELEAKLNYVNLEAGGLYGDADKTVRSLTLRRFREGKIEVLVASDIASRGLDIEELELVINFDPPIDSDHYVHRSGRTGRMGRKGTVISLVTPQEQFIMNKFSKELGIEIAARQLFDGKLLDAGERQRKSSTNIDSAFTPKSKPKAKIEPKKKGSNMQTQPMNKRKSKKELELERKNKGAPRWLKDKK
jgi:superfamily II DNA/RNA helicase